MDTRRQLLKKILFGATATALPVGAAVASAGYAPESKDLEALENALEEHPEARKWLASLNKLPTSPAPWELLAPLTVGSEVGLGWQIAGLGDVQLGAVILTLRNAKGYDAHIHISRNDGSPIGLTHTREFDLVVMNGGDGERPSDEDLGRVVMALGEVIQENEKEGGFRSLSKKMLSHADRASMFGPESLLA